MQNEKLSPAEEIREHGKSAQGRKELIKHLDGDRLTMREAILAKCYDCCGHYVDGKDDCRVTRCPLHPFMPYRESRERESKRTMTEDQKASLTARFKRPPRMLSENTLSLFQHPRKIGTSEIFSPQDEGEVMSKEVRAK